MKLRNSATVASATALVLAAGLGLAGCDKDKYASNTTTTTTPASTPAPTPAPESTPGTTASAPSDSLAGDAMVTAKVKTKMAADDDVKALQVNVDTKDGVVTLTGTVDTRTQATKAEQLAAGTEGVRSVTNNLVAKSG
jgi:hypothetical protein